VKQTIISFIQKVFTANQEQYSVETLAEAARFVYQNKKTLSLRMSLVACIFIFILLDHVNNITALLWLATILLVRVISYWQATQFLKQQLSPEEAIRWGNYFTIGEFFLGLLYGLVAVLFFTPDLSIVLQLFILMFIMYITFGALTVTSHWLPSFYALMFPALGMTSVHLFLQTDTEYKLLALIPAVTILISYAVARLAQRSILSSIQLRFENNELVEKLKMSNRDAEEANKRKTRFLASASHDLRQPVHALELFSEALNAEKLSPRGKDTLAYLKESISSLNGLLTSLLDISRLDAGIIKPNFEALDASVLVKRLAQNFDDIAKDKGLDLRIRCQQSWVYSDRALLENTLRNLLSNAIKYTNKGGVLLNCRCRKEDNEIWIEIWDTGIGVAESEMNFIFDEFYQINNIERDRQQGLGLGLAIVCRETKILGHSFSMHSQEGRGTLVRVKVRRVDPTLISPQKIETAKKTDRLSGSKIIVIDDDKSILVATRLVLEQWGCDIETASNLDEAENICKSFVPDVIISDFRLRENVTGIDVIEQLRLQLNHSVPAILITGDTAPDRLQQAKDSGLILLHKPLKPAKLRAAINMGKK